MWHLCWSMNVFEYVCKRLARYTVLSKNICIVTSREIFCFGGFKTYMFYFVICNTVLYICHVVISKVIFPLMLYSCSFSQRLFYSQIQSDNFQSDKFPLIMHLIVHVSLYNSSDVWMILLCLTINDFKMCNYNHFRSIWILCKLYNVCYFVDLPQVYFVYTVYFTNISIYTDDAHHVL